MYVVCIQVNKRDVMKYTGDGKPPFCMITIKSIYDETPPSNLEKCTVNLVGVNVPNELQLTRKMEYSNIHDQLCELNKNMLDVLKPVCSTHC